MKADYEPAVGVLEMAAMIHKAYVRGLVAGARAISPDKVAEEDVLRWAEQIWNGGVTLAESEAALNG